MYIDQLPTLNTSTVKKECRYLKFSFSCEVGIQGGDVHYVVIYSWSEADLQP